MNIIWPRHVDRENCSSQWIVLFLFEYLYNIFDNITLGKICLKYLSGDKDMKNSKDLLSNNKWNWLKVEKF